MSVNWEVVLWTCITLVAIMGSIALILIFISSKNMRKKRQQMQDVHTELGVGSKIMFAGGIYGRVVGFDDEETVNVEVAKNTIIKISRYSIQEVMK